MLKTFSSISLIHAGSYGDAPSVMRLPDDRKCPTHLWPFWTVETIPEILPRTLRERCLVSKTEGFSTELLNVIQERERVLTLRGRYDHTIL